VSMLHVGQTASTTRAFSEADLASYRALSGDRGLLFGAGGSSHENVPGPLLSGMFSRLLGTELPGRGTNWLKQSLRFPATASLHSKLTATVQITRLRPEKRLVNLRTVCTDETGLVVCEGEALVLFEELEASCDTTEDE
jgi:3-hydroxybutyryl-CoA dehydratase